MDNLKPQIVEQLVSSDLLSDVKCMAIDNDLNIIYCVNQLNQLISIDINNVSSKKCCEISSEDNFELICVEFLSEERSVCMVSNTGDIIVFNTLTETFETVGTLSMTVESVSFSLDQELIILLTQNNLLILMNKLFDILAQKDLNTEEIGCNPSVSVNWGSKLTQFHGEGKRDIRAQKENFKSFSDFDDKKSRISWRADGLYFVTSYFNTSLNYRKLHVWNREAVLQYTSEQINGLEQSISWKPSGTLIASSQMLPNKHMIVFIEKNGLKHGEFELPFPPNTYKLELILWSNDSQILLTLVKRLNTVPHESQQILMLWRQTNYKWDLKQNLHFKQDSIKTLIWDPIDATLLHIMLSSGKYMRYRWKWSVDESEGYVGVIDGKQLKLTNMKECVIPPPFFSYSFNFDSEIRQICLSKSNLAVILSDDSIYLFEKSGKTTNVLNGFSITFENFNEEKELIFNCLHSNKCQNISSLTNIVVDESGRLFGEDSKHLFCFQKNDSQKLAEVFNLKFNVLAINCLDNTLGIVSDSGHLWKANLESKTLNEWIDRNGKPIIFPLHCSRLELLKIEDNISVFCLTENFTLCSDNEILSENNCNSFIKFNDRFLIFTTIDHLMHSWLINDNSFVDSHNNYLNFKPRSVERGSKIITSSNDGKIVLQMPRGNLETIYPRPLLLDLIKFKLDKLEFDLAFDLLRRHRINLNILYDYNSNIFIENIQLFIEKIGNKSIAWICLFLNDLSNQDFYAKMIETNEHKINKIWSKKVCEPTEKTDIICDLMRETMDRLDSHKYLNPILLTYLKKSVPETGNALKRIKSINDSLIRDKSIKFLLYSININTLVDEALGSYDFDTFLMIASKTQKDPKEYLALLEELNKIESFDYKCYKIDIHLKRYKNALTHISKCEHHFEECLELIRNHSLYRDSIVLFENSSEEKKQRVWKLYAEYLFDKKYFEESAIAFKRSGDFVNAVKAYQLSDNWSAAIECCVQCPHLINIETMARNLAKHLVSVGKYFEASYLLETYANDCHQSITVLIDGHEWEHALRLMATIKSEQLLQYFKTQLITHFYSIESLIEINFNILSKHMNRLEIVRQKQNNEFKSFDNFDDKSEIYSETNSWTESKTGSNKSNSSSLMTKKSRKSIKKSEKKKYILKEGSNEEDIQLIYAIKELILSTDQMQEEISLLVKTLYNFYYLNESKKLQNNFIKILDLIKQIIEEIWSSTQTEESAPKYVITDPELIKGPELRKIDWKLAIV